MSTARKWRVAVLNRHFGKHFGGAESYSVALVEHLAQTHDVHVFAQHISSNLPGVTFHQVPGRFKRPRWLNQLWFALVTWWMTRRGFDVVHSHENTWHGDIQTVHVRPIKVGLFRGKGPWGRWLQWLGVLTSPRLITYLLLEWLRYRPQAGRLVVASSDSVAAEMRQAYPRCQPYLRVIPPGVDLVQPVPPGSAAQSAARAALGVPANVPLALFVGNDYAKKGLPALLQALAALPHHSLHLAVVGNPTHIPAFRQQSLALGLQQRVHFLGALQHMAQAYSAADLLVHPTTEDTYAMVVLEAMAHGLPVVVSAPDYCGIAADLTHDHNALIVPNPRDPAHIAASLQRLQLEPDLAQRLRAAGPVFAAERSWLCRAEQQSRLYADSIAARQG